MSNPGRGGQLGRRSFIEGVAASIGMLALGTGTARASEPGSPDAPVISGGPPGARGAQYSAVDGLLVNFVAGYIKSVDSSALSVSSLSTPRLVQISLTAATQVCARESVLYGALDGCRVGDRVMVGTSLDDTGNRSARWVVSNPISHCVSVTTVGPSSFDGIKVMNDGTFTSHHVTAHLTQFTNNAAQLRVGQIARQSPEALIAAKGDLLYLTGTADVSDIPAPEVWALTAARVLPATVP